MSSLLVPCLLVDCWVIVTEGREAAEVVGELGNASIAAEVLGGTSSKSKLLSVASIEGLLQYDVSSEDLGKTASNISILYCCLFGWTKLSLSLNGLGVHYAKRLMLCSNCCTRKEES